MSWYQGKRVLLIGGSKGIGKAAAIEAVIQGASVVVAARGREDLEDTVAAMKAANSAVAAGFVQMDVTDETSVQAAVADAISQLGGIDVLICNSGASRPGLVHELPIDDFQRQLELNYLGHVRVVKAVLPHMYERGSGDVCLVSSMAGIFTVYGYAAYSGSKFAILGFAEALRQEAMLEGVRVTVHLPPSTETPGYETENEMKPPYLRIMEDESSLNSVYDAPTVARHLLRTVEKGTFHSYLGFNSWLQYFASRTLPGTARWLADGELRAAIKKAQKRGNA